MGEYSLESQGEKTGEMPEFTGKLGGDIQPRHVFFMETRHSAAGKGTSEIVDMLLKRIGADIKVPEEVLKKAAESMLAKLEGGGKSGPRREYHTVVLVEDKTKTAASSEARYMLIAGMGHTHENGTIHMEVPRLLRQEVGDYHGVMAASLQATALNMQYNSDWKGERVLPAIETEVSGLDEANAKMAEAGYLEAWRGLIPQLGPISSVGAEIGLVPQPTAQAEEKMTKGKRAVLVKRFGEKAIRELEKRVAEKKSV